MSEACCICATLLENTTPPCSEKESEKHSSIPRFKTLECCSRIICASCIHDNPRYTSYCPYCQTTTGPNPLPPHGLRAPPSYPSSNLHASTLNTAPPPYTPVHNSSKDTKNPSASKDIIHYLHHPHETLAGLSLLYSIPLVSLKKANNLTSDHLLQARKTIVIPEEFYKGPSRSPRPVESEEVEWKKSVVRKFMVGCKVHEYDVALLYLKQADYDFDAAVETYRDDERWEREHPLNVKDKAKKSDVGKRRFTGQKS